VQDAKQRSEKEGKGNSRRERKTDKEEQAEKKSECEPVCVAVATQVAFFLRCSVYLRAWNKCVMYFAELRVFCLRVRVSFVSSHGEMGLEQEKAERDYMACKADRRAKRKQCDSSDDGLAKG